MHASVFAPSNRRDCTAAERKQGDYRSIGSILTFDSIEYRRTIQHELDDDAHDQGKRLLVRIVQMLTKM